VTLERAKLGEESKAPLIFRLPAAGKGNDLTLLGLRRIGFTGNFYSLPAKNPGALTSQTEEYE